jgi:hypothetical protein
MPFPNDYATGSVFFLFLPFTAAFFARARARAHNLRLRYRRVNLCLAESAGKSMFLETPMGRENGNQGNGGWNLGTLNQNRHCTCVQMIIFRKHRMTPVAVGGWKHRMNNFLFF